MKKIQRPLLLLAALFLCYACSTEKKSAVVIHPKNGSNPVKVIVEVAQTAGQRSMGLMYRKKLGRTRGMLFLFEREQKHRFTMRNTAIPLDILFIDSSKTVIGILENTKPYANGPFSIDRASRYALEVNAGFCARNGISTGDTVVFISVPGHDTE